MTTASTNTLTLWRIGTNKLKWLSAPTNFLTEFYQIMERNPDFSLLEAHVSGSMELSELPHDVHEEVLHILKHFDRCWVYFGNGRFHVYTGEYPYHEPIDFFTCGCYKAKDYYIEEELKIFREM